ncbi:MAG: Gfo/Idh/MocA family protein [Verrucomicrobiota bacterium]
MEPLKVGILGCGKISQAYFTGLKHYGRYTKVVGAADIQMPAAERAAEAHGIDAMTVDEMLTNDEIELIVNLTIPSAHAPLNQQILESGKHAYCEKPFALNRRSGFDVIEKAKEEGLRVGCAPDTVLGAGIQTCRKLIDEGTIGEPQYVSVNMQTMGPEHWHPNPQFYYEEGGGPLWDMGPYYFSALVTFFGPAAKVVSLGGSAFEKRVALGGSRVGERFPVSVQTHYLSLVEFASGVSAQTLFSFDLRGETHLPLFEIYGTEGSLAVPDPNHHTGEILISTIADARPGDYGPKPEWHTVKPEHTHGGMRGLGVADMAAALRNDRPHRASAEMALYVVDLFRCLDKSSELKRFEPLETTCERPAMMPIGLAEDEVEA